MYKANCNQEDYIPSTSNKVSDVFVYEGDLTESFINEQVSTSNIKISSNIIKNMGNNPFKTQKILRKRKSKSFTFAQK